MTNKDEAIHALDIFWDQSGNYLLNTYGIVNTPEFDLEYDNRYNAYQTLIKFIESQYTDVKVVYEYKLQRQDGKYLNKSSWDEKGKTYKNRAAMISALGQYISEQMKRSPTKPRFAYTYDHEKVVDPVYQAEYAEYRKAYHEWYEEHTKNKEVRARYIPLDWVVSCIPVNTKADIQYKSAKLFYMGK